MKQSVARRKDRAVLAFFHDDVFRAELVNLFQRGEDVVFLA